MTQALDAAIRAACITNEQCSYPDCGCSRWPQAIRAALRAALPAEAPEWFVTLYSRYTSYQGAPRMWADIRAQILGDEE